MTMTMKYESMLESFYAGDFTDLGYWNEHSDICKEMGLPFHVDALSQITGAEILRTCNLGDVTLHEIECNGDTYLLGLWTGYPRFEDDNFERWNY